MFAGHFAAAMAAKRIEPSISLGTATLAALLADFLVFLFLIAGLEHFDPVPNAARNRVVGRDIAYSHSLVSGAIYGAVLAAGYRVRTNNRFLWSRLGAGALPDRRLTSSHAAWILFALVISHWILDVISHRPDMPLAPGISFVAGLSLWNSMPATLIVEGGFWMIAVMLYVSGTRPRNRAAHLVFWVGAALITLSWYRNISVGRAGIGGLIFFSFLVGWAYWTNRLRPCLCDDCSASTTPFGRGSIKRRN